MGTPLQRMIVIQIHTCMQVQDGLCDWDSAGNLSTNLGIRCSEGEVSKTFENRLNCSKTMEQRERRK